MITIVIPDERPESWNKYYSGMHWKERSAEAKRVHNLVRTYLVAVGLRAGDCYERPVNIAVNAYFKSHPLDADNIAAKLYIDGMKGYLIADDTPKYVVRVSTASFTDKLDPRIEIILEEAA